MPTIFFEGNHLLRVIYFIWWNIHWRGDDIFLRGEYSFGERRAQFLKLTCGGIKFCKIRLISHFLWINDQSESNHQIYQIKKNGTLASRLLYLNLALRQGFYRILPERHHRRATMCQHDLDVGCEKWHSSHKKVTLKEVRRMSFWKLLQRFKESPPHKGFMPAMKLLGFWSLVKLVIHAPKKAAT